jgi:hypothetical protein
VTTNKNALKIASDNFPVIKRGHETLVLEKNHPTVVVALASTGLTKDPHSPRA